MSLQWADFPSNQPGIYGSNINQMLNGSPWVALDSASLVVDPDPSSPNGYVLRHSSSSSGPTGAVRLAVTTPHTKVGVAFRFYVSTLPSSVRSFLTLNSTGNGALYGLRCRPNGGIELVRGTTTVIATADYPILLANSWRHVEIVADVTSGVVEVRVQGITIPELSITDSTPPTGTIGLVGFPNGNPGSGSFTGYHTKDLVVYNGAGSSFNTFVGSVSVGDLYPSGDVTLGGWTTSSGSTGWNLIDETSPDTADYIQANDSPPAASEFSFTNLDADVTSVKGLIAVTYAAKTDGGDGNLQTSLSPNGVDYDAGADRAITSAATYYYDVSELSPVTSTAWTPTEVNSITMKVDRTA